ncbi:MAG: 16S rRNA (guanine(966)-N(2))-methyltransferase RsmD [Anaerolineae bacterium]
MRVIAGSAKGRPLLPVPGEGTRPITDRVKSALFNILGPDIEGATFLDLFAGTGGVGIEALSRGAERAVFLDLSRKAIATLRKNLETTGLSDRAEIIAGDAFRYLAQAPSDLAFDYVYVAPPQYEDLWARALLALHEKPILAPDGLIIVQIFPKEFHPVDTPSFELVDERHYGSTALLFYQLRAGAEEP